jgi:MFS family permease
MSNLLQRRDALLVFLAFACAYFLSALVRATTATLAPAFVEQLSLSAAQLGLLAGAYFLGFSAMQLPMGQWLDRFGPRRVEVSFLAAAAIGCLAFSLAQGFVGLLAARLLCGAGFAACLMAPLTGFRRWYEPAAQLRSNSWMLMTGSLGMLAATLPVQWLMPWIGWRGIFSGLTVLVLLAAAMLLWRVPAWNSGAANSGAAELLDTERRVDGYGQVWRHPYFRALAPMGFFCYGGMLAMQTLWAGPWMVRVGGATPLNAAAGLFFINLCMLCTFWGWGMLNPLFLRLGWNANRLMAWGMPASFLALLGNILLGTAGGWWGWALYCVACSCVTLSQPALGLAFPAALAGRALSAFNLVLFIGVFTVQWGVGIMVDAFRNAGFAEVAAFQGALAVLLACCVASYGWFLRVASDNPLQ